MENLNIKVGADVQELTKGLDLAGKKVNDFGKEATTFANKTNTLTKSTANAVPALTSFSQVVQDAPYGIRGVANNITQLTQQFGYLSKSTGGTKAALKAMLGTLAGPAGILFAVSAITSLLVVFSDKLFKNKSATDENKDAQEALNKVLKNQSDLRKQLNSELTIASEIAKLEAKLAGKSAGEQYKASRQFRQANIALLEGQLAETERLYNEYDAKVKATRGKGFDEAVALRTKVYDKYIELEQKLNAARAGLRLQDLQEQVRIQDASEKAVNTHTQNLASTLENAHSVLKPVTDQLRADLQIIRPEDLKAQETALTEHQVAVMAALADFNQQADQIIRGGIAETFAGLAEAIGGALSQGENIVSAVGASLLSTLGGVLVDLGKLAISVGIGLAAIKKALQSLNPVAAIAAGVALVALGSFFKGAASNIGKSMGSSGGSDYGSSSIGSSRSYSSNIGSSGSFGGGTVVFEIAGTKLVGVLSNTLSRNRSLGGSLNVAYGT